MSKLTPAVCRYGYPFFFSNTLTAFIPAISFIMVELISFYITRVIKNFFRLSATFTSISQDPSPKDNLENSLLA
jgi:hypothetical protein